ncbi:c-di-GMP-binding flagellar brake protein YcgR [Duganella sp. HSC-15S17]|uniref:C-di-GMP-binding flagellar brake protein YcgR n=2 Tax=Duganella violaceipulchra TaxID=2849652 RepID=A0ABT1GJH7_9BURK|nr:c-di-GMP-binding flagellar brake protein YcgR [Duganella violaceicalia]
MLLTEHTAVTIRKGPPRPQDAIGPIPAAANTYDMTTEDDIGDAFTSLAASGEAISMYTSGVREPVLGRILSVDPEQPHFVMELNEGSTLQPGKVTFVTVMSNAKIQFRLSDADWNSLPGQSQLIPMKFPETCAVLNRRASERVETPLGVTFMAAFEVNGRMYELPIYDFALGGMGLRCTKSATKGLLKGRKVVEVRLELETESESESVVVAEMEIRVTRGVRSFLLGEQLHVGCMFTQVSPEAEADIKTLLKHINHATT